MAFSPKKAGEWELFYPKRTASVVSGVGCAFDWPSSPTGYVVKATSSTTKFAGIAQKAVASTDADYASNPIMPLLRPLVPRAILIALTASAVATDVGARYDLTDENTVNRGASSVGRVLMEEYYSATSVGVRFLDAPLTGST